MERKFKNKVYRTDEIFAYSKETGEEIQLPRIGKITVSTPTKQVRISSQNYLYLDTDRLRTLKFNGITEVELGLLLLISENLSFNTNVCMQENGVPHTTATISTMLGQTQQGTKKKLNRLINLNTLSYKKLTGYESLGKVYIVNPFFLRRGKDFTEALDSIFKDISVESHKGPIELLDTSSQPLPLHD